jgi:hypothetical protein
MIETETQQLDPQLKFTIIAMVILPVCLCLASLALTTMYFSDNDPHTSVEFAREYGGSEELYRQILTSDDCFRLDEEYRKTSFIYQKYNSETSFHKRATGIMKATIRRMNEIGCNN